MTAKSDGKKKVQEKKGSRKPQRGEVSSPLEGRDLLHILMDNTPDLIYIKDVESRFIMVNQAEARHLGLADPQKAVGKSDFDFFPQERAQRAYDTEQHIMQSGQPLISEEIQVADSNNASLWLLQNKAPITDQTGKIIGLVGISRDISDLKETEAKREHLLANTRQSEQLLRSIIDATPDWIFIKDQQHRYVLVNKGYADALHRTPDDFVGKDDLEMGFPEEFVKGDPEKGIRGYWADDRQVMDSGKPLVISHDLVMLDDELHIFNTVKAPLRDAESKVWGVLGLARDVTARERLLDDLKRRSRQLQTAAEVSHAAGSILDPETLIWQLVNLALERFDLYYAGLFLVDENREWAVLRAGTGEAGQKMLDQGHKLRVGGDSMVGQCVAKRHACIALDVGAEPVRFANPLLPETRSELALPLVSHGETIGALTIQSAQEAAFSPEEITVLQTMADQLANAIANAQLYKALRWEQYLMRSLMDNVPDYIYFKDKESRFIRNSMSHAGLFGVSDPAQVVGKSDSDFFAEEHARRAYEDEQQIIRTGHPMVNVEEKGTFPDGREQWYLTTKVPLQDEDGNIVGTFGITKDITERKQAEEREARRQKWLEKVLELGETVAQVADLQTCLLTIHESVHLGLGFDRVSLFLYDPDQETVRGVCGTDRAGEVEDTSWYVVPVEEHEAFHGVLSNPKNFVFSPDYSAKFSLPPEHEMYGVKEHVTIAAWAGEEPMAVMAVDNLLTERHMTEEQIEALRLFAYFAGLAIKNARLYEQAQQEIIERKRAEEALAQQAQALDAELEQIFYVASHHLQEPLRAVVSYSQLLQQRYGDKLGKDADELIGYATSGATRIQALINDLLAFSRIGTHQRPLETIDSSAILDRALSYLKFLIEQSGAKVTRDPLPVVIADEVQLTQLFQNLIDNAIKFCNDHSPEIHISAEYLPPPPAEEGVSASQELGEGEWIFSVRDNGMGIEPQYFDRIFQIFQRLHGPDEYPGTGIGLAICKKIVERHGGRIWVESEPGQGSTFRFTIPDGGGSVS
jgi:PAS domain S-box-containing protein